MKRIFLILIIILVGTTVKAQTYGRIVIADSTTGVGGSTPWTELGGKVFPTTASDDIFGKDEFYIGQNNARLYSGIVIGDSATMDDSDWRTMTGVGTTKNLDIPANSSWGFRAVITGIVDGVGNVWHYEVNGLIKRDGSSNTSVVWYNTESKYEDDSDFHVRAIADDTNERLLIQYRDATGDFGSLVQFMGSVSLTRQIYAY